MKTVLWISRHEMTEQQRADLEQAMGGPVRLTRYAGTVGSVEELRPALREVDAVAAVLPTVLLAALLREADGKPVLLADSERRPTGRTVVLPDGRREAEFAFVHAGWRQVISLELETRSL